MMLNDVVDVDVDVDVDFDADVVGCITHTGSPSITEYGTYRLVLSILVFSSTVLNCMDNLKTFLINLNLDLGVKTPAASCH